MQLSDSADGGNNSSELTGSSPRDGKPLPPVQITSSDEILRIVARAREAQRVWCEHSPRDRAKRLRKLKSGFLSIAPQLTEILSEEHGKSIPHSYANEILGSADLFTFWASEAPKLLVQEATALSPIKFRRKAGITRLCPRGVIALIAPWNYPILLSLRTLLPALAAGNAVVLKPSEFAPRSTALLFELFAQLDVPDLVGLVQGDGHAGEQLIETGVDHVVFVGSITNGRKVARHCADRFLGCSLDLGGKDAALVLDDAELPRTVEGLVWGAFSNAGQDCSSIERVYVVEEVAEKLIAAVVERTGKLTLGGDETHYDVGPLVRADALNRVKKQIDDAVDAGATLQIGGKPTGVGLHFEPTVLTGVDDDMAVMTEETFGPVMSIAVVRDQEEAIARANRTLFGLTASIWTRDIERGRRIADRLKTGVVTINNHSFTAVVPHAPWRGRGHSGGGITNSRYSFYDLVAPQYIAIDRNRAKELWWFPHNAAMGELARAMAVWSGGAGSKLKALLSLLRSWFRRWK